ncbi:hypothetical protein [Verrucomicrobium sp. BvORR106]|uniref:hypothetical protein n=1 Tax=Verrucomicrobium sp. BvORR106 TaxID=1403819 RepID=UPI00056F4AB5|nr:hypothetical protein [Verrucomicrobium sp. BvORR106]
MNATAVEASLKEWLTREGVNNDAPIVMGLDVEEVPIDTQCVVAGCTDVEMVVGPLRKAQVSIVIASPMHTSTLAGHRALVARVADLVEDYDNTSLATCVEEEAGAFLRGIFPKDGGNDEENGRWLTAVPFIMGLQRKP